MITFMTEAEVFAARMRFREDQGAALAEAFTSEPAIDALHHVARLFTSARDANSGVWAIKALRAETPGLPLRPALAIWRHAETACRPTEETK